MSDIPVSADLKQIGAAFRALRVSRDNISQRRLAALAGVAQGTISNIEAGRDFEFGSLLALLNVLDRQMADFLHDAGFTDEHADYKPYKLIITLDAKGVRGIHGDVSGPGLRRAK
jgi:transcriptional regulator with XRE-family HTH domain